MQIKLIPINRLFFYNKNNYFYYYFLVLKKSFFILKIEKMKKKFNGLINKLIKEKHQYKKKKIELNFIKLYFYFFK